MNVSKGSAVWVQGNFRCGYARTRYHCWDVVRILQVESFDQSSTSSALFTFTSNPPFTRSFGKKAAPTFVKSQSSRNHYVNGVYFGGPGESFRSSSSPLWMPIACKIQTRNTGASGSRLYRGTLNTNGTALEVGAVIDGRQGHVLIERLLTSTTPLAGIGGEALHTGGPRSSSVWNTYTIQECISGQILFRRPRRVVGTGVWGGRV